MPLATNANGLCGNARRVASAHQAHIHIGSCRAAMRAIAAIGIRVAECAHIAHHAIASEPPRLDPRTIEHHGGTAGIVRAIGRELRIELADRNDTSHERVVDRAVLHEHVNGTVDRIAQLAEIEFAANLSGSRAGVNSHIGAAPSSQQ